VNWVTDGEHTIREITPEEIREFMRGTFDEHFGQGLRNAARLSAKRRPEPQRQNPRQVDQEPGQTSGPGAGG